MRILIIEDETLVARSLEQQIRSLIADVEILAVITSVESGKKWFKTHESPDLVLSDIQLSDGLSFDIFEPGNINAPVIFTTAYDEFAVRAFRVNSIDYLLKPIDTQELSRALEKYRLMSGVLPIEGQLKNLVQRWGGNAHLYKERFLVSHGNSMVPIHQDDIACFHKEQLIYVHTMNKEKFITEYHALDEVEDLLDPTKFFRVNRQYILHIQSVEKIKSTHKGLTVIFKGGDAAGIDVSREKAAALKKWLG